jgi:diguanylate cyclase (GGDEF)-like protein
LRRKEPATTAALRLLEAWYVPGVAAVGGAALVAGVFDPGGGFWLALLIGAAVTFLGARDVRDRLRGHANDHPLGAVEGPLLWILAAWMLLRLAGRFGPHLTPLAAGLVAWFYATWPRRMALFPLGAAAVLEFGLTVAGRQSAGVLLLHLLVFGAASFALSKFARSEAHRTRVREERARAEEEAARRQHARDFGLLTTQAPALTELPQVADHVQQDDRSVGHLTLDFLQESIALQLDLLRASLNLDTAAVLWRSPDGEALHLRGLSTARQDRIDPGPYPPGAGLTASLLRDVRELALAPVKSGFGGLPYYRETEGVGGVLAVTVSPPDDPEGVAGILIVDRASTERWTDPERQVVRLAARKLALDVGTGQRLKATDQQRNAFSRFCAGLRELNAVLGLDAVSGAAIDAVRAVVQADLVALSVVQGDTHRVVAAKGLHAERFQGLQFAEDEGLVGRAVRLGHPLPSGGRYRGARPVFTSGDRLTEMRSLLIVPLSKEGGPPIGALTVAARAEDVFASPNAEMLQLIADQVAIKLDLARAHDQIREMATVDGLTGLKNHRVFQQAFDMMLERAERRKGPICVLLTDIDKFKGLNDTYGHPFGDKVLKGVARVLQRAVRGVDLAARYGGEEFVLLLEDSDVDGGRIMAERIRTEVEGLEFPHETGIVRVTLSLGIAAYPDDGRTKPELIERADQALYRAKQTGRNRAICWRDVPSEVRKSVSVG